MLALVGTGSVACSSAGTITTQGDVMVNLLDESYSPLEALGKAPVQVPTTQSVARLKLTAKDRGSEYVVIVYPDEMKGDLPFNIGTAKAVVADDNNATASKEYLEMLLRTHRLILRRRLTEANRLLAKMNDRYDLTYGSQILAGNIALLEGKLSEAQEHYQLARSLFPEGAPAKEASP
jgi:hypothetical protein